MKRKRIRNSSNQKALIPEQNEPENDEHVESIKPSKKKKIIPAKVFESQVICPCKLRCAENIDVVAQKSVFERYYRQKWSGRTKLLRSLVERKPTKKGLDPAKNVKERNFISKYFLNDDDGKRHQVCSSFLTRILQIDRKTLYRAMQSVVRNPNALERRGKYPTRRTDTRDIQFCKQFINKFATFDSHHDFKYLHPRLKVKTMYDLYCQTVVNEDGRKVLSMGMFRKIFKRDFNLRTFKRTKKCHTCVEIKKHQNSMVLGEKGSKRLERRKKFHKNEMKSIQREFFHCVENATENDDVKVLTFGLQISQEIPSVIEKESLQFRPLWGNNLCVYDEVEAKGYMYVWCETVATRGSSEIAACLYKHFQMYLTENVKQVILYSDPNSGQTRNIKLAMMLHNYFVNQSKEELEMMEQRFFDPRHSYNSVKRCFKSIIEQTKTIENLFLPQDWFDVIAATKFNGKNFIVHEMKKEDFYRVKKLEALVMEESKLDDGKKVDWSKFQRISFNRDEPFTMQVKQRGVEPEISIILDEKSCSDKFTKINLMSLDQENRAISKEKYDDLNSLLEFMPEACHQFYLSLKYTEKSNSKDYGLASRQTSEDESD